MVNINCLFISSDGFTWFTVFNVGSGDSFSGPSFDRAFEVDSFDHPAFVASTAGPEILSGSSVLDFGGFDPDGVGDLTGGWETIDELVGVLAGLAVDLVELFFGHCKRSLFLKNDEKLKELNIFCELLALEDREVPIPSSVRILLDMAID